MTPDKRFRAVVLTSVALGVAVFFYYLVADLHMPLTSEARINYQVTQVAPEVSGRVVSVLARNNQFMHRGDVIFEIDPSTYERNYDEANLLVEQAGQDNSQLDASIAGAQAEVRRLDAQLADDERQVRRFQQLVSQQFVSAQALDQARAKRDITRAQVASAQASLRAVRVQRGQDGAGSLRVRRAQNSAALAKLSLQRTRVVAEQDGVVSNLHLEPGAFAQAGAPKLALIDLTPTINADFREKALLNTRVGSRAEIVFDALPGQVFPAQVSSIEPGILRGQIDPDGHLASTQLSDRWVRDAERVRINLRLLELPKHQLITGGRATVQLYPHSSGLSAFLGRSQIRFMSLLHYVY